MYTAKDHTFVILAYKDNPNISTMIESLKRQTVQSKILMSTSTPSEYLENICKKYDIEMRVRDAGEQKGSAYDWNFAYDQADTPIVTLAHQDDYYEPKYLETILSYANLRDDTLIIYTDYYEIRNDKIVTTNKLLKVKRLMNAALANNVFYGNKAVRLRILSAGDPVNCPSIAYFKKNCGPAFFDPTFKTSLDYKAAVDLARKDGAFIYIPKKLIGHRISELSATSAGVAANRRKEEDTRIFKEFWPEKVADVIYSLYSESEKSNTLEEE